MGPEAWLRLRELFAAAVLLTPAQRPAFLDRECGSDAELRREVEDLLLHDPGPAENGSRAPSHAGEEDREPVQVGDQIGNIRVVDVLGAGGMGKVYIGYDETLQRRVALKAIGQRHHLRPEARARFLREARILSQLEHPNICRIYDYQTHGGSELLVLELIDGPTLSQALEDGLSFPRKLEIAAKIAEVLAAAHQEGIIHRDLKPDNVMLNSAGEVKVLDFGLARAAEAAVEDVPVFRDVPLASPSAASDVTGTFSTADTVIASDGVPPSEAATLHPTNLAPTQLATVTLGQLKADDESSNAFPMALRTERGQVMGTPVYMSPEQARGEVVTTASDMYSFGLLLQWLFTEERPYPRGLDPWQILARAQRGETLPVSGIDRDVAALVEHLEAAAPAARPTALAAVERLRWIADKPKRRLRRLAAAAVTVLVVLAAMKYTFDLRRERAIAELSRSQAEDLIGFMLGDLREKLAPVGRLEILDDVGDKAMEYFAALPEEMLNDDDLARRAQALRQIGDVRMLQGNLEAAMKAFQEALTLARGLAERDPGNDAWQADLGASFFWVGYVLLEQADHGGALEQFRRYAEVSQRLVARDPDNPDWQLEVAYGHTNIAEALRGLGDVAGALEHYEASVGVRRRLVELAPEDAMLQRDLSRSLSFLGSALQNEGRLDQALGKFEEALEIRRQLLEDDPKNTDWQFQAAVIHNKIGKLMLMSGHLEEALEHFDADLRLIRALVRHDPTSAWWARSLAMTEADVGKALFDRGDAAAALEHFAAGEEILSRHAVEQPGDSWKLDSIYLHLVAGPALLESGDAAGALRRADEVLESLRPFVESPLPPLNARRNFVEANILRGRALEQLGQALEAKVTWRLALVVIEPLARESRDPVQMEPWARTLLYLGRVEEARPILAQLGRLGYRHPRLLELCRAKGVAAALDRVEPIDPVGRGHP